MSVLTLIGSLCLSGIIFVKGFSNYLPVMPLELPVITQDHIKTDTTVYMIVEMPPEFPGGRIALFRFIESASKYQITGNRSKDSRKIFLKLLVEIDGSVSDVIILSSDAGKEREDDIKRIVSQMPKWKPGYQSGRRLRVYSILSIYFL